MSNPKKVHCLIGVTTARSMIHPQYASRFIKKYLIDYETDFEKLMKN